MSDIRGVVVAHGDLARSLVDTVAAVSGSSDALHPIFWAAAAAAVVACLASMLLRELPLGEA